MGPEMVEVRWANRCADIPADSICLPSQSLLLEGWMPAIFASNTQ
jgi:hypothetical protein